MFENLPYRQLIGVVFGLLLQVFGASYFREAFLLEVQIFRQQILVLCNLNVEIALVEYLVIQSNKSLIARADNLHFDLRVLHGLIGGLYLQAVIIDANLNGSLGVDFPCVQIVFRKNVTTINIDLTIPYFYF